MVEKTNDLNYMRKYLFYAFQFEQYVYLWTQAMLKANSQIREYESTKKNLNEKITVADNTASFSDSIADSEKAKLQKNARVYKIVLILIILLTAVAFAVCLFITAAATTDATSTTDDFLVSFITSGMLFCCFLLPPFLIFTVVFTVLYKNTKSKLKFKCSDNSVRRQKELALENSKQMKMQLKLIEADEINVRINQQAIRKNLLEAQSYLSKIYSENVLPVRYRTLEATGTLYGYIVDGRCTYIKGHGGIYDTFEHDYQNDVIIMELKKANAALARIEANQRLLLQEVRKLNSTVSRMEQSLNTIKTDISDMKCSMAISAAANQQTAAATSYMANVMYFNR